MNCRGRLVYSTNILAHVFSLKFMEGFAPAYIFAIVFEVGIFVEKMLVFCLFGFFTFF